ncbi:MAG TPA: ATP-grasp domain-containing protein [Weissella thailandensis]|uniref:ATP-grasp domain-containing protein n=1 Tax=Weissella thailandensis TaxID=89061 RepID=UPI001DDC01F6|nr:ATP-grasp domain-containing protein [Weissella thailandensis]HJG84098.1 ATP-grasp domain-containing protein [Weissella thailandensis]
MSYEILPGTTIGIIGEGITSRYLAQAAHNMGYQVAAYSSTAESAVFKDADYRFLGDKDNDDEIESFAALSDMITYTSAWLPTQITDKLANQTVPQGTTILDITDDHALAKAFYENESLNILPYETGSSLDEIAQAGAKLGYPIIVKPIFKHKHIDDQVILRGDWDLGLVAPLIDGGTLLVEPWLENTKSFVMTAVRGSHDDTTLYPLRQVETPEQGLTRAWTVGDVSDEIVTEIKHVTEKLGRALNYIGAYDVTFLLSENGTLYLRNVIPGLSKTTVLYDVSVNISVTMQHLRAVTGQRLAEVIFEESAVYMPITEKEADKLYRHWQIQPHWQISMYQLPSLLPQMGHVLAVGSSSEQLLNQLHVAGVWQFND